jgi:putative cell wall-binding protein
MPSPYAARNNSPFRPVILGKNFATHATLNSAMAPRKSARKSSTRTSSSRKPASRRKGTRRWSARVTRTSDALTLDRGVFTWKDPRRIARSLKRSAMRSRHRKADPYRSALSMLTFYLNRAGKNLPADRRRTLQRAKGELRKAFGRA